MNQFVRALAVIVGACIVVKAVAAIVTPVLPLLVAILICGVVAAVVVGRSRL